MSGESPSSSSESPSYTPSSPSAKYQPAQVPSSSESPDSWGESPSFENATKYSPPKPSPDPEPQNDTEQFLREGTVKQSANTLSNSSKQKYK